MGFLDQFDVIATLLVGALFMFTAPIATGAYWRMLRSGEFGKNYSIWMIVINGSAELMNCFFYTFSHQMASFSFASPFYAFLIKSGTEWVVALLWSFFNILSIHTRFYIAITRLSSIRPSLFNKMNSPWIFIACIITVSVGTLLTILDLADFNKHTYVCMSDTQAYLPRAEGSVTILKDVNYGHKFLMSCATLIANLSLVGILASRRKHNVSIAKSYREKQERGLIITSIVSYLFYMIVFINGVFAREFKWGWPGYCQYLFLGLSCHSPFWCMIIFSASIRVTILRRNQSTAVHTSTLVPK